MADVKIEIRNKKTGKKLSNSVVGDSNATYAWKKGEMTSATNRKVKDVIKKGLEAKDAKFFKHTTKGK